MDWIENAVLGIWLAGKMPTCRDLYISSPYITRGGLQPLIDELSRPRRKLSVTILTCLEPMSTLTGALDLEALTTLINLSTEDHPVRICHVPNLHAKVFIVDKRAAVVGSGNLTRAGTQGINIELGIRVTGRAEILDVTRRFQTWLADSDTLTVADLESFGRLVEENYGGIRRALAGMTWGRLEIFPSTGNNYFDAMRAILKRTTRSCPTPILLDLLSNAQQGKVGSQTAQARLLFLQFTGLMEKQAGDSFVITDTGRSVTRSGGASIFAHRLCQKFPVVKRTLTAFCRSERKDLTYPELAIELADDHILPQDATDEVKDAVRWLRSLGLVEECNEKRVGNYKHFQVTTAGRLAWKRFMTP